MIHCIKCGKEIDRPSRSIENYTFTVQDYDCGKCRHNFKVTINKSLYIA
jgi:Zn finger protein HypA/HybF involved in hydrogenase expression